ncbi:hypothetical protein VH79_18080 [Salmonella enterica]|uniref:Bro-N domain-containing protein n=1 Tax=Salmonella enterica TaxID=28901 RepID=A0A5U3IRC5_SALER|nr:hypothetical protein [Salmonella enterica]
MTTQLTFHETQFNITEYSGQIWLRGNEISTALGMNRPDAVTQIYHRNTDEFNDTMTRTLNLRVQESSNKTIMRKTRVFSLRGAHLIAMFARTPVAKEFRRWVLDILDREVGGPVIQPVPPTPTYPPFSDDYANRTELIYYHDFKPIFCRILRQEEIVMTHEGMKEWLEMQGLMFFTREELKNMTHSDWLKHIG